MHQKSYWQPSFDPKQVFFYLLEPLEVPNPDKMPEVNVKTEALPQSFLVQLLSYRFKFLGLQIVHEKNSVRFLHNLGTYKMHQISEECKLLI